MSDGRKHCAGLVAVVAGIILLSGCAAVQKRLPSIPKDVTPQRKARTAEVVANFEHERSRAQHFAATSRWQSGDAVGARQQIQSLLNRDPNFAPAQQLLAEIDAVSAASGTTPRALPSPHTSAGDHVLPSPSGGHPLYPSSGSPVLHDDPQLPVLQRVTYQTAPGADTWADGATERVPVTVEDGFRPAAGAIPPSSGFDNQNLGSSGQVNREAVRLLRSSQPDAAVAFLAQALAGGMHSADLYRSLGLAHYRRGEYGASQLALQQALSLDNRHPLSYFLMGFTLAKLGDSQGADWHFREAAARDPKYAVAR